jgi:hypothetical protein
VTPDEQRLAAQAALYDEVLDTQITTHVVDFLVRTQMLLRIADQQVDTVRPVLHSDAGREAARTEYDQLSDDATSGGDPTGPEHRRASLRREGEPPPPFRPSQPRPRHRCSVQASPSQYRCALSERGSGYQPGSASGGAGHGPGGGNSFSRSSATQPGSPPPWRALTAQPTSAPKASPPSAHMPGTAICAGATQKPTVTPTTQPANAPAATRPRRRDPARVRREAAMTTTRQSRPTRRSLERPQTSSGCADTTATTAVRRGS